MGKDTPPANHFFCIHAHFYQPPREDPLTGKIPIEPGAAPYENWNERIYSECYRPNAEIGNFMRISYNIGPTLVQWLANHHPSTLSRMLVQDRNNVVKNGVGNAMAQAYNHSILPLATRQDKITQVRWGMADFSYRFGRKPKGMWLPETAVDTETLEVLAECGIDFTILAPWQAEALPKDHTGEAYQVALPGDKRISAFFYDQDISTRLSFDPGATTNADGFIANILQQKYLSPGKAFGCPQLITVASDGELYGHHQVFRDKFLAYLTGDALMEGNIRLIYPELWLKEFPPTRLIRVLDYTSWSCHHGVIRWKGECACTPFGSWKGPLRQGLNSLAELIDAEYLAGVSRFIKDPWELRNQYIHVILGEEKIEELIFPAAGRRLDPCDLHSIELLLKAQYERQRMFTSCGWFFDDFDRIEPRNNVAYAAQAVWLTSLAGGQDLSEAAYALLKSVRSRRTGLTGAQVFASQLNKIQMAKTEIRPDAWKEE